MKVRSSDPNAQLWQVIDSITGTELENVIWADDQTHQICFMPADAMAEVIKSVKRVTIDVQNHKIYINRA